MLTKILEKMRFITLLVVIISFVNALALLIYVTIGTVDHLIEFAASPRSVGPQLHIRFIKLIDVALLAMVFQLIAVGTYELFIDREIVLPEWMKVRNLDDLKNKLVRVIVLVLAVSFLTEVVEGGASQEIAFVGLGIAVVIVSLTYFSSKNYH
jgi:uncharacterized membrane protein YqhA